MMTCCKRCHPSRVSITSTRHTQDGFVVEDCKSGRFWHRQRSWGYEKVCKVNERTRIYSTKNLPNGATHEKPAPTRQMARWVRDASEARETPALVPYTHVSWLFPTPIIISFTSSSFLADSNRSRCARNDQPVLDCLWISPQIALTVIDH